MESNVLRGACTNVMRDRNARMRSRTIDAMKLNVEAMTMEGKSKTRKKREYDK